VAAYRYVSVLWLGVASLAVFGVGLVAMKDVWFVAAAALGTVTVLLAGISVHRSNTGLFGAANRAALVGCAFGLVPVMAMVWFVCCAIPSLSR
jgi:hypothetical protein